MKQRNQNIPAVYLVLITDNKILLLRRFNTGFEDGKYSMIAGHVEDSESCIQSMVREAKEEADIQIRPEDLKLVHIMHRHKSMNESTERIDMFFQATNWQGEIKIMESNKCDDLSWFDLDNLPENTLFYVRRAIKNIERGIYYSEFGFS